ncbi:MAG: hypothetical protein Q8L55_00340 [Phycisphaerales bacterium]|nr:hypothetical protein [Phycisphaerales bacterium]
MTMPTDPLLQLRSALALMPVRDLTCGWAEIQIDDGTGLEELQLRLPDAAPPGQVVIGCCTLLGDPIGVDCTRPGFPVWAHMHDEASWEPEPIAGSLEAFGRAAALVQGVCVGRDNGLTIETNPVTSAEIESFSRALRAVDPEAGVDFWELFLGL